MAGRPRSFNRDVALRVAVERFWADGYDATTVASLTEAMGITAPSLYAAFGDKDRLYDEAVACYAANIDAGMHRAMERPTVQEALRELLELTAHAHTAPDTPRGCLVLTEPRLEAERARLRRWIVERIDAGVLAGDLPADADAERLGDFILAVLAGMSSCARDGGTPEAVLAIARTALAAIPRRPSA